jgi:hypothetical protein
MPDRAPTETTNLDTMYGSQPIPWSRPRDLLAAGSLACTVSGSLPGMELIFEGEAQRGGSPPWAAVRGRRRDHAADNLATRKPGDLDRVV